MRKFAEILRAFVIAVLAILIINTTTITILEDYVFNKDANTETVPTAVAKDDDDEGLSEDLMALFMTPYSTDEVEEDVKEQLETFDEHTNKENNTSLAMFSIPSLFNTSATNNQNMDNTAKQADAIYNKYYSILAGMQASYEGRAASILNTAKSEYYAAVQNGEKRKDAKSRLYSKYFSVLSGLLGECNGAVEGVLAQMTAELNSIGASTAPVNTLRGIYNSAVSSYTAGY